MDLTKLNQVSVLETKPLIKISNLPENIPQPILSADLITTKYGETILIEFQDSKAFLPKRVVPLMKDNLTEFTDSKYSLIFTGLKDVKKPSLGTTFHFIENYSTRTVASRGAPQIIQNLIERLQYIHVNLNTTNYEA
ncbi:hypothetical protein NQ317_009774 [Molorchus minor]|uniref:Uncharacterized protein n=1 Tax=Molorchus minor TaxID=1323400 RepID=A0ABQ9K442_9CUCU|nr:hypothetical protein NQ317_009774 [Molorchus minor]